MVSAMSATMRAMSGEVGSEAGDLQDGHAEPCLISIMWGHDAAAKGLLHSPVLVLKARAPTACRGGPGRACPCQIENRRRIRVQVVVRDNNVEQALKALKKKLQREGVFREMKLRRHFEKPSERRAREAAEAVRRARKVERKRMEREGF
jgi:small subunit ribosomal protein S21